MKLKKVASWVLMMSIVFVACFGQASMAFASEDEFVIEESIESLPVVIQSKVQEMQWKEESDVALVHADGRAYAILSLGVRPSAGYDLEIEEMRVKNQMMWIQANEVTPNPEQVVAPTLTSPIKIVSISDPKQQIKGFHAIIKSEKYSYKKVN